MLSLVTRLFVPITLELEDVVAKGERRMQWSIEFDVQAIYIGRRLQCRDEDVMTFTLRFFPRVQVKGLSKHIYFSIHIQHLM